MFVRPTARQSLFQSRLQTLRRIQLPPVSLSSCPLISSSDPNHRLLVTQPDLLPWRRRVDRNGNSGNGGNGSQERGLATAMEDMSNLMSHAPPPPLGPPPSLQPYELRPIDPSNPLVVRVTLDSLPRSRVTPSGVPGDVESMMAVFHACIQILHLERAAMILKRFGDLKSLPDHDMIALHDRYLRANLDRCYSHPPEITWADDMRKWFETNIRGNNLSPTPETIACMLKILLLSTPESQTLVPSDFQDSLLRHQITRYMSMLQGDEVFEVFSMASILSDEDLAHITKICPMYNFNPDDWIEPSENADGEMMDSEPADPVLETASSSSESVSATSEVSPSDPASIYGRTVRPVPQKGLGLASLTGVLSFFGDIKGRDLSLLPLAELQEIQGKLERDCVDAAIEKWRREKEILDKMGHPMGLARYELNSQLYNWLVKLEARIGREIAALELSESRPDKNRTDADRCVYGPFLRQSTPARLAAVTILSVINTITQAGADTGAVVSRTVLGVAKAVEEDVETQKEEALKRQARKARGQAKRKRRAQAAEANDQTSDEASVSNASTEAAAAESPIATDHQASAEDPSVILEAHEEGQSELDDEFLPGAEATRINENIYDAPLYNDKRWPVLIRSKVGAALVSALIQTAKLNVTREHPVNGRKIVSVQPAFAHTTIFAKGKKVGMITPNRALIELLKREPRGDFLARHLPMLVTPKTWTKFDSGGFIEFPTQLIRQKNGESEQRVYAEVALKRGDLDQVCQGLDILGRTGWKVNQAVFKVMLEAWNRGEAIADIPPLEPQLDLPPEPENNEDPLSRRRWFRTLKAVENEKSSLHSQRCFMNFQMEIANAFRDQVFYLPHNLDFRGRAYPMPTYFNHMGADSSRSLLKFAKGKKLGARGLKWLKVHLSNVFGFDKASLSEREQFATDHMDDIRDSVIDPLGEGRWWLKAEDPWQCLATCFELHHAVNSPDPTEFVSHLPVHQDGTCNGLQHYAALGGDLWGAQQVNLEPGDKPADVYSAVADLVKEGITKDLEANLNLAQAMDGKITRKVVKQTVMTNVYGVTFIGAREQVLKQIEDLYPNIEKDTGIPTPVLALYVATKIFKALGTMFRGAHDIQYWLGECAGRVCRAITAEQIDRFEADEQEIQRQQEKKTKKKPRSRKMGGLEDISPYFRSTLVWTTPLGLPVVQPYRQVGVRIINTSLQDLHLQEPEQTDPVNRRKQLQAFPPNFIHSLDATHMLLSAIECDQLGLSFAAVHDSFWTHAGDIDVMNRVLRDCFIRVHSEDVIKRLASEFIARHKDSFYLAKIEADSPAISTIVDHRKKVRMSMKDELIQERQRQRLLASEDPEEKKKGLEIVTPSSIFESYNATETAPADEEHAKDSELFKIPDRVETKTKKGLTLEEADEAMEENLAPVEEPVDDTAEEIENVKGMVVEDQFRHAMTKKPTNSAKRAYYVWRPMSLPELPVRGDWNVERLRDSQYFFS